MIRAGQAVVRERLEAKLEKKPAFVSLRRGSLRAAPRAKAGPARIRTWDQGIMSPLL